MNSTFSLPPVSDPSAIQLALNLLTALADAKNTKVRLQQFADAQDAFIAAKRDHDDAAAASAAAAANLGDLTALASRLADDRAEHDRNVLALQVASEANSKRSRDLDERERAVEAQTADLQRRVAAHDGRVKQFRDTVLAG
jgi:hypothetical protein